MSELSNILVNTDFEKLSVEELVRLEDSLQQFANTSEKDILRELKQKIEEQYGKREARFEVHQIRTGYAEEGWGNGRGNISREDLQKLKKRQKKGWDPNNGWKFHLDVVPNRNHPVTKAVSEFLLDININHKIAAGGVNGKGMTVYVGSYDDINKLARVIQERFGKDIYEPPAYTGQARQEYAFQPTVYGRFVSGWNGDYPWGIKGLGLIHRKYYELTFSKSLKRAVELGVLKNEHSVFSEKRFSKVKYGGELNIEDMYLRGYCCHKLYAAALGEYYCGSNIEDFEKKFFGDKLPAKGTEKRRKWNEVAKTFVEEAKTLEFIGKNFFDFIKSFKNGYEPLDLSRIQAEHTSAQSKPVAENNIPKPKSKPEQKPKQETKPEPKPEQKPKQETKPEPKPKQKPKQEAKPEPKPEQKPKPELTPDISVVDDPTALPVNSADNNHDKEFAKPYRKFYQGVAKLEKAEYIEDETSPNYNATLVRQNGEEVNIIATRENRISLRGKDKEKNYKIPDYKDFNYLAMLAKKTGKKVSFGNIKSPEFKARLLLACLENNVMMTNVPKFSEMENVDQDIMQRIKDKLKEASDKKNATQQSQQTNAATPKKEMPDSVKRMFNNKRKKTI